MNAKHPANSLTMFHWHTFEVVDPMVRGKLDRAGQSPLVVVRSLPGGFMLLSEAGTHRRTKAAHLDRFLAGAKHVHTSKDMPEPMPWKVGGAS
jgi:hypothetical protein